MTLFRNTKNRLCFLYKVTPPRYTGHWYEEEDYFTHKVSKVSYSKLSTFTKVAVI